MYRLIVLFLFTFTTSLMAQDYSSVYAAIDRLAEAGKYRSALVEADRLFADAEAAGDQDDMVKALTYRAAFTKELEEDGFDAAIRLLRTKLAENPGRPVVSPLLHLMVGQGFHAYAQRHAYELRDATAPVNTEIPAISVALEDYNLRQLVEAADYYLLRAAREATEQRVALSSIPALVANMPQAGDRSTTLYDLIVEEVAARITDPLLVVDNSGPLQPENYLVPAPAFARLSLDNLRAESGPARRLRLFQEQINYHLATGGEGLLRVDVARVDYLRQLGIADTSYLRFLDRMYEDYAETPGREVLLLRQAAVLATNDVPGFDRPKVNALEILDAIGDAREPDVHNAVLQLRRNLLRPGLEVMVEESYLPADNLLIHNRFRNVRQVHYRLVRLTETQLRNGFDRLTDSKSSIQQLASAAPVAERSFVLPDPSDHEWHTTETWLPRQAPGAYALIATEGDRYDKEAVLLSATLLQVTGLALLEFDDANSRYYEVQSAENGRPLSGVRVEIRQLIDRRSGEYSRLREVITDDQGRFNVPSSSRNRRFMILRQGDDRLVTGATYTYDRDRTDNRREYPFTPLFTDRAVFRPGQTVLLYGITLVKDRAEMPKLLTGEERDVILRDANYQEIARQSATSDEFGRFHLEFELPSSGLTGVFRIETEGGSVAFRVEEYKRPKFQVELTPPLIAVGGDSAAVAGTAQLFPGPGLNDATVNYRIFLEEQRWYYWYRGNSGNTRELVGFGETETDDTGAFRVRFLPDANLAKSRKRYQYIVEVDVADATGETHSTTTTVALRGEKPSVALRTEPIYFPGDSLLIQAVGPDERTEITYTISKVAKPDPGTIARKWGVPEEPLLSAEEYRQLFPNLAPVRQVPLREWPVQRRVVNPRTIVVAATEGRDQLLLEGYAAGYYRIDWAYPDGSAGEPVQFEVHDVAGEQLPEGVLFTLSPGELSAKAGVPMTLTLLASVDLPHVIYSFASRKGIETRTVAVGRSALITYTPTEADRGGIQFDLAFTYGGRLHRRSVQIPMTWDNKELDVSYATFRDKLRPGEPEEWVLTISHKDGTPIHAAAVASMYDASLDAIAPGPAWEVDAYPAYRGYRNFATLFLDGVNRRQAYPEEEELPLRKEVPAPVLDLGPLRWHDFGVMLEEVSMLSRSAAPAPVNARAKSQRMSLDVETAESEQRLEAGDAGGGPETEKLPVQEVSIRRNLQETAFWRPEITSTDDGQLRLAFTSPEALTKWRFRILTHDRQLNFGYSEREVRTQKELMVLPNVPRFLREGDVLDLTARVNNLSDQAQSVQVSVEYFDPETGVLLDLGGDAGACDLEEAETGPSAGQVQTIGPGLGKPFCFPLDVPEGLSRNGLIGYRVIARSGNFSDGEENVVPVLSDRTLVTVAKAFYLKKREEKKVSVPLLGNADSPTLQHVGYTFEATTNPAWMALKALPYLMEYPYDCTEQLANRYFANQLAYVTVRDKPVLEQLFTLWQADSTALQSELTKNEQLKYALLTETPWVRAAQSEAEQRARIATLFDLKTLAGQQSAALDKLQRRQNGSGAYSWFPGGPDSRYITQYVLETLARMQQLGVTATGGDAARVRQIIENAVNYLDGQLVKELADLKKSVKDTEALKNHRPGSHIVHYLYARSASRSDPPTQSDRKEALAYYAGQAIANWTDYGLYEQALIASAGDELTAFTPGGSTITATIITSLRERALRKDEFGMYWKYGRGYRWNELPVETHCRILEAFRTGGGSEDELDEMRLWLLTQKRTNRWPTTKATAAAVYALLNTGSDWVARPGEAISVNWPDAARGLDMKSRLQTAQTSAEAGTGTFQVSLPAEAVSGDLASVTVRNRANDLVWGSVFWQYTELATKVVAADDGPLSLERRLFHRVSTDGGERLVPVSPDTPLNPGSRVTVQLRVRTDRDLDFVHLKDRRAATFEPVEQLSGYRYENGLGFYFAPGDLATNLFIDHLPRGAHTLEYDVFSTYTGTFSNGLGRIQCMYAPEFAANTDGAVVVVE